MVDIVRLVVLLFVLLVIAPHLRGPQGLFVETTNALRMRDDGARNAARHDVRQNDTSKSSVFLAIIAMADKAKIPKH